MREISGYCVPSEEYRQKYELEAQQNMELRQKAVLSNNIIAALQKELEASRQQLSDRNATVRLSLIHISSPRDKRQSRMPSSA